MALELQLSTSEGIAQLTAAREAITAFAAAAGGLQRAVQSIEQLGAAMSSVHGFGPGVVGSIEAVVAATAGLSGAVAQVEAFGAAMSSLGTGATAQAAAGIERVAASASGLGAAAASTQGLSDGLQKTAAAAEGAAAPVVALGEATEKLKAPPNISESFEGVGAAAGAAAGGVREAGAAIDETAGHAEKFRSNVDEARASTSSWGGALSQLKQAFAAIGIAATIEGLIKFGEGATAAAAQVQGFVAKIDAVTHTANDGSLALQHIADTANKFAIPLGGITDSAGRFIAAMVTTGHSVADAEKIFDNFAVGLRGFGATQDGVNRTFYALTEVIERGSVSMQQLRRQMGNVFPALELLAQGTGRNVEQLTKLIATGKLSADAMQALGEAFAKTFGGAALAQAETGVGALNRLQSALFILKATLGADIFSAFKTSLQQMADLVSSVNFQAMIQGVVALTNAVGTGLIAALHLAIDSFGNVANAVIIVVGGIASLIKSGLEIIGAWEPLKSLFSGLGDVLGGIGSILGTSVAAWITYTAAVAAFGFIGGQITAALEVIASALGVLDIAVLAGGGAWATFSAIIGSTVVVYIGAAVASLALGVAIGSLINWFITGENPVTHFSNTIKDAGAGLGTLASKFSGAIVGPQALGAALENEMHTADAAKNSHDKLTDTVTHTATGMNTLSSSTGAAAGGLEKIATGGTRSAAGLAAANAAVDTAANRYQALQSSTTQAATALAAASEKAAQGGGNFQKNAAAVDAAQTKYEQLRQKTDAARQSLGQVADKADQAAGGTDKLKNSVAAVTASFLADGTAVNTAASAFDNLHPRFSQTQEQAEKLGTALPAINTALGDGGKAAGDYATALLNLSNATGVGDTMLLRLGNAFPIVGDAMKALKPVIDDVKSGIQSFLDSFDTLGESIHNVIDSYITPAFNQFGSIVETTVSVIRSAMSSLASWIGGIVNTIVSAVTRAIAAIKQMLSLQASSNTTSAQTNYYGGLSSNGGGIGGSKTVDSAVFAGARHFATGGVTGGGDGSGIPSILHPNEAVIPLQGGAVPVTFTGTAGGQGNAPTGGSDRYQDMYDLAVETKTEIVKGNQSLVDILSYLTSEYPKFETALGTISTQLVNTAAAIATALSSAGAGSSGSSYTGGSSSGGSIGGGSVDTSGAQSAYASIQQQAQQASIVQQKADAAWQTLSDPVSGIGSAPNRAYWEDKFQNDPNGISQQSVQAQAALGLSIQQFIQQYGQAAYDSLSGQAKASGQALSPKGNYSAANGSPNLSVDSSGGFQATLHPNEAVIPLPDGRSVPVTLPAAMMRQITAAQQRGAAGGAGATGRGGTSILMNIQTPDANSFRKSQQQIVSDLRGQINRAQDVSATSKRVTEDPTKTARTKRI